VSGASCDHDSSCQLGVDASMAGSLCLPISGLGFDQQGDPATVCPLLDGYTQKLYSNAYCVIDCDQGRCPDHLPVCATNPLAGSSPNEAKRYCAPAPAK
jgi:hypothetical protein